jgi:hypothetical protein
VGGACRIYVGDENCIQVFGGEKLRERDHFDDLDVDRIILKRISKK